MFDALPLLAAGLAIGRGSGDRRERRLEGERAELAVNLMRTQARLDGILNPRERAGITVTGPATQEGGRC